MHVQLVRPHKNGAPRAHMSQNVEHQRDIFWPLCGVLQRFKFTWCSTTFSGLNQLTSEFRIFRKIYLKSDNSSQTAYSCNARLMVSFCTLMSDDVCESLTLYRTGPKVRV